MDGFSSQGTLITTFDLIYSGLGAWVGLAQAGPRNLKTKPLINRGVETT